MRLNAIILFLSTAIVSASQAQNEYNIWYFGEYAGLNFNTLPPSALTDSKALGNETGTGICDKNGNLLFYTNGDTIYNRNHQIIKNWQPTLPYLAKNSARQGCIAIPKPYSNHLYYIFMGRSIESYSKDSMLRYWTIDMNGDGGLGEVIEKEKPLLRRPNEAFALTLHANKKDFWVALISPATKNFECIRTTNGQFVTPPVIQKVTIDALTFDRTNLKFSPDGRFLCGNQTGPNANTGFFNLYPFDNNTGQISTPIKIPLVNLDPALHIEFSPDSKKLYISYRDKQGFTPSNYICQYDLSNLNASAIIGSKTILHTAAIQSSGIPRYCEWITSLQLGPDGKIYCHNMVCNSLSTIENPNLKGLACNFNFSSTSLGNKFSGNGGPYYPNFWFREDSFKLGNDTLLCIGDSLLLDSKLITYGRSFKWNTGDSTPAITVKKDGQYILTVTYPLGKTVSDTITVSYKSKYKVYLGSDTAFCHQFSHQLNAGSGFKKYNWNNGDSSMMISVNQKGIYSVRVIDSNTCPLGDTIAIDEIKKPVITLAKDTITCRYIYLSVTPQKDVKYSWNNGDTGLAVKTLSKGRYIVSAYNKFCSASDTINVKELPSSDFNLGPDITLCKPLQLKTTEAGKYLWSTGSTAPAITIQSPGIYWLKITRNNCSTSDTILVTPCNNMQFYIPDAFSPNDDGINDVFSVSGINITYVQLTIYNRWGEIISTDNGTSASWNGLYKNSICPEGVYVYRVKITGYMEGRITFRNLSGTVTLLR